MPTYSENPVSRGLNRIADSVGGISELQKQNPAFDSKADILAYLTKIADTKAEHREAASAYISVILANLMQKNNFSSLSIQAIQEQLRTAAEDFKTLADKEYANNVISDVTIAAMTQNPALKTMLREKSKLLEYTQNADLPYTPQQERDFNEMRKGLDGFGIAKVAAEAKRYDAKLMPLIMHILGENGIPQALSLTVSNMDLTYLKQFNAGSAGRQVRDLVETRAGFDAGIAAIDEALQNPNNTLSPGLRTNLTKLRDLSTEVKTNLLDKFEQEGEKTLANPSQRNVSWSKVSGAVR